MTLIQKVVNFTDKTFNKGTKDHLIGGVGRLVEKRIEVQVYAKATAGLNNAADDIDERFVLTLRDLSHFNYSTLTREVGSFLDDGLIKGDNVILRQGAVFTTLNIRSITDSIIIFIEFIDVSLGFIEGASDDTTLSMIPFQYTAVEVISGFNTNSNKSTLSLIDNTNPRFVGLIGGALIPQGHMSGYIYPRSGGVQSASYGADSSEININLQQHIGPFFEDYQQCDDEVPSFFFGQECSNWHTRVRLLKSINNPNGYRELFINSELANTGWQGESYNQGASPYSVEEVEYTNYPGNKKISGIQLDKPTEIRFVLKSAGLFQAETTLQACFSTILEGTDHKEKAANYVDNVYFENSLFSSVGVGDGTGSLFDLNGEGMSYVTASFINSSTLNCRIRFVPGSRLRNVVRNEDRKLFQLWINTEIFSEADIYNTKEVPVPIACGELIVDPNLDSLLRLDPWTFFEHDELITGDGKVTYNGYLTDDVFAVQNIGVRDLLAEITNIKLGLYVEYGDRGASGEFALEEYNFKTEGQSIEDMNASISRGYLLNSPSDHNHVKISRNTSLDGAFRYLKVIYAWRIRYEDWVKNPEVPELFYNPLLKHDGKNEQWNILDDHSGAKIYFRSEVTVKSKETGALNTERIQEEVRLGGYNEAMDDLVSWSAPTQKTFKADGTTNISPKIQRNEATVLEYDFVSATPHGGEALYYGECHAENFEEGVLSLHEISTIKAPTTGLLIPNIGQSALQITEIDANTLRLSCSVNKALINKSKISIYPRIGRLAKPVSWILDNFNNFDASFDTVVKIQLPNYSIIESIHPIEANGFGKILGIGDFTIGDFSSSNLVTANFSLLTKLTDLDVSMNEMLKKLYLPQGEVVSLDCHGCDLNEINLTMTEANNSIWEVYDNTNLTFVEFKQGLVGNVVKFDGRNCDLDYIDFKPIASDNIDINIADNWQTQDEVDQQLMDLNDSGKFNGTFIADGTNSSPGVLGATYKTALEGKGWTITTNI